MKTTTTTTTIIIIIITSTTTTDAGGETRESFSWKILRFSISCESLVVVYIYMLIKTTTIKTQLTTTVTATITKITKNGN